MRKAWKELLVKVRIPRFVIPAKAGIHLALVRKANQNGSRLAPDDKQKSWMIPCHRTSLCCPGRIHPEFALCIARLSTDSAASCTASDKVGCACTMRARSSDDPLNAIATTASAISSET